MELLEDMIGPKVLARMIDVPLGTLEFWRQTGQGPRYFKIGRLVKYRVEDVDAWLEARIVEPLE